MIQTINIQIKRIYDPPDEHDGLRVLVDSLWPRGLKKAETPIDIWKKELAPSPALRKWFGHQAQNFDEFRRLYLEELESKQYIAHDMLEKAPSGTVTLLYAARDVNCNHAIILRDFLLQQLNQPFW